LRVDFDIIKAAVIDRNKFRLICKAKEGDEEGIGLVQESERQQLCFESFNYLFKQIPTFQTLIDVYMCECICTFYGHNIDCVIACVCI